MNPTDLSDAKSEEIKQLKKLVSHLQEEKKQLQEENQQLKKKIKDTTTCVSCDKETEICVACGLIICAECLDYSASCVSCEAYQCASCTDKTWCRNHNIKYSAIDFLTICPISMEKCLSCDKANIAENPPF